ncbi:MAG: hypothetical protein HYU86_07565 [Chloroflexi bacterium]|nr:hypothetical protein [Chloroflexota bacterium]
MTQDSNYWTTWRGRRLSRRQVLRYAARAGIGVVGLSLAACAAPAASTPTPTKAPGAPAATPTRPPAATPTPVAKTLDKLVVAYNRDIVSADPHVQTGNINQLNYADMVFDTLVTLSREEDGLKLAPSLASSWKVMEDDPKTWEFKLRQGVKFHNGEDFDADTVVFNIERNLKPELKLYMAQYIAGVTTKAVDKYTVRMTWPEPYPLATAHLSRFPIAPRKYVQEKGDKIMSEQPVGTGPYKFVKWVKDSHVEVEWAGSHWQVKTPPAKTLIQSVIPEIAPRIASLQTGAADVIWDVPPDLLTEVTKDPNVAIYAATSCSVPNFGISQLKEGPLRDKRVRLALNLAIDRQAIVKNMFGGYYKVIPETVLPISFGYNPNLKPYPFDPKRAKDLLAEAGYPDGFETVIDMGEVGYARYKEYTQAIAEYWRQIGVKATVKPQKGSWSDFARDERQAKKGPEGIMIQGFSNCILDADGTMGYFVTWDPKIGAGSYTYIDDPKLDKMVADSRTTMDTEKRKKILQDVQAYVQEQSYDIPLWSITYNWGFNKKKLKAIYPRMSRIFLFDVVVA